MTEPVALGPGKQISLPGGNGFKVSSVSEANLDDARHRGWQQAGISFAALTMFVISFFVTIWVAFLAGNADAELRNAAIGIFVALAGALGGFLGGRATKQPC